jgi:hypothetical protein
VWGDVSSDRQDSGQSDAAMPEDGRQAQLRSAVLENAQSNPSFPPIICHEQPDAIAQRPQRSLLAVTLMQNDAIGSDSFGHRP